jgi:hypothetical protein
VKKITKLYVVTQSGMAHLDEDSCRVYLNVGDEVELTDAQAKSRSGKVELKTVPFISNEHEEDEEDEEDDEGDAPPVVTSPAFKSKKKGKVRK